MPSRRRILRVSAISLEPRRAASRLRPHGLQLRSRRLSFADSAATFSRSTQPILESFGKDSRTKNSGVSLDVISYRLSSTHPLDDDDGSSRLFS